MMYLVMGAVQRVWHTGEPSPMEHRDAVRVTEIQVDGDELYYVLLRFDNLPRVENRKVVRYFGDHARFIAANLT